MRVADSFVLDRPQAETLCGVIGRLLQPAVVEDQILRLSVFEIEFAVVGAVEPARQDAAHLRPVEASPIDQGRRRRYRLIAHLAAPDSILLRQSAGFSASNMRLMSCPPVTTLLRQWIASRRASRRTDALDRRVQLRDRAKPGRSRGRPAKYRLIVRKSGQFVVAWAETL